MSLDADIRAERTITPREFAWLRAFLRERTGIELKDGKEPMVMSRLDRRLRQHDLTTYGQYFALLGPDNPLETRLAIDLLTTNETYFFREPKHFEFLAEAMAGMPRQGRPVRIWSAAASSGEEAYTIAMVLAESLPEGQEWEVLGTDISSRVLETARRGLYPIEATKHIPGYLLRRYCLRGRDEFDGFLAIGRSLRSRVSFRDANLIALPADLGRFDIVFLRNVMIYFGTETKRELIRQVTETIRPGGYLMVGHSESLSGLQTGLRTIRPSIYQVGQP